MKARPDSDRGGAKSLWMLSAGIYYLMAVSLPSANYEAGQPRPSDPRRPARQSGKERASGAEWFRWPPASR